MLAIGNWTTIAGIAPVLRQHWPKARIIGYRDTRPMHDSFGMNVSDVPLRFNDWSLLDSVIEIPPDVRDTMDTRVNAGRLAHLQIGRSSLMGLCAAEIVAEAEGLHAVGTIFYDQKLRY